MNQKILIEISKRNKKEYFIMIIRNTSNLLIVIHQKGREPLKNWSTIGFSDICSGNSVKESNICCDP